MTIRLFINRDYIHFHTSVNKIALIVGSILFTNVAVHALQKCYVCGPSHSDVNFASDQPILSCDNFDEYLNEYIQECPPNSKGCGLQKNGTTMIRTCETNGFLDCKIANQVSYCFCRTNLCNAEIIIREPKSEVNDDEDDEDGLKVEGSGQEQAVSIINFLHPKLTTSTPKISVVSTSGQENNRINYMGILLIAMCFYRV